MRRFRWGVVVALAILTAGMVLGCSSVRATDAEARLGWETLRGHVTTLVAVEDLPGDLAAYGLAKDELRTMTEARLKQAGIAVSHDSPSRVRVSISGICEPEGSYCVGNTHLEFRQRAVLTDYVPTMRTYVTTWRTGRPWGVPASRLVEIVKMALNKCIDDFINDWLLANAKK